MKGFWISFFCNLIFHSELLIAAIVALLLYVCFHISIVFFYILLGLWVLVSLLITLGLGVLSKSTPPQTFQKNINPYSKKTKDFLKNRDDSSRD